MGRDAGDFSPRTTARPDAPRRPAISGRRRAAASFLGLALALLALAVSAALGLLFASAVFGYSA
jgi:hypothetical protein